MSRPLIVSNGGKYMIHPDYLYVNEIDIVPAVIDIIKEYQSILYTKDSAFAGLLEELKDYSVTRDKKDTLQSFLTDDSEARIFEIISYAILETHYKNQKIYVYCRSGRRSAIATETLKGMGYTNVTDLGGLGQLGQYGLRVGQ